MSNHTPGPWHIGMPTEHGTFNANTVNAGESAVAQVYGIPNNTRLEEVPKRFSQGVADARLIAAAPDLLAALIACEARLRYYDEKIDGEWGGVRTAEQMEAQEMWCDEIYAARAAIAKVTEPAKNPVQSHEESSV